MQELGKWIVVGGIILVVVGVSLMILGRWFDLGRLPGDIVWKRDNVTIYIPLTTMLLLSLLLTIVINLLLRFWNSK